MGSHAPSLARLAASPSQPCPGLARSLPRRTRDERGTFHAMATANRPALGVALGTLHPSRQLEVAIEADRLGFESVWLPEHLVFPVEMGGSPFPGAEHPPVPPATPVFDCFGYLCFLAARTERVRLGSHVYLLGLRHPFVAARAIQTLDLLSGGRALAGVGAGWLRSEWTAAGFDPATRGRRLDEAIGVCRRLWTDETVAHSGAFWQFDSVMFEPKPAQRGGPPVLVGGESEAALRRAARLGDGWIGLAHTRESAAPLLRRLAELRRQTDASERPFTVTLGGSPETPGDLECWRDAGVDRLIVSPWQRSREAVDGLRRLADWAFRA
jgi:probable F420-dependent oxidoreductase